MAQAAPVRAISSADMLSGAERAAVLVMYLNREVATKVLANFSSEELQEIGLAMADVEQITPEVIESVVAEFVRELHNAAMVPKTGPDFALNILPNLIDDKRRPRVVSALNRQISKAFAEALSKRPARTVAAVLQDEHPQTQAVAMLLMGSENAARVLRELDEEARQDLTMRMARVKHMPGELVDDVEAGVLAALEDRGTDRWEVCGVDNAARILGQLDGEEQDSILDLIATTEPDLADTLRKRMLVFEDLVHLGDRGMQALLKQLDKATMVVALRGADRGITDRFLSNMSSRAAQDTKEEIELQGALARDVVEQARQDVVDIVMRMRDEGTITLAIGGSGGDML